MILYYAIGGGLGHLTRARAVAHTLELDDVVIVAASSFAGDRRVIGEMGSLMAPSELAYDAEGLGRWLRREIERMAPTAIYVDVFPAGILGELRREMLPDGIPLYHIARIVRWDRYEALAGDAPRYERSYVAETLTDAHESYLREHSDEMTPIVLRDPPATLHPSVLDEILDNNDARAPLWIVTHSGPPDEVDELLSYARELAAMEDRHPSLLLVSPVAPTMDHGDLLHIDIYPAHTLFPYADRIITACGFNAMRQAVSYTDRHRFVPFPRRYDDQFLRAAQSQIVDRQSS